MFKWMKRLKKPAASPPRAVAHTGVNSGAKPGVSSGAVNHKKGLIDSLDDLIKTPGKACYKTLVELASSSTRDEFILSLHCPAFVGSGIQDGSLEKGSFGAPGKGQKTQLFSASQIAELIEGASLDKCIFLLRKPLSGSIPELTRFTIGRTQDNDILMMDYAISRCHAEVEIRGQDYYLKDLGSSNGSYLNGKLLDDRGALLTDCDIVRFGRYEFQFLSAGGLYDLMRSRLGAQSSRI